MLVPLTNITSSGVKFIWTKTKQYSFEEIERIGACGTLLVYQDLNGEFKNHTNTRNLQLGTVIILIGKPISFHSRKLTDA